MRRPCHLPALGNITCLRVVPQPLSTCRYRCSGKGGVPLFFGLRGPQAEQREGRRAVGARSPVLGIRSLFRGLRRWLRTSLRRINRRRCRASLRSTQRSWVPPWGRVRSWQVKRSPGGHSDTYVILQLPKNAGSLATNRIASALKNGLDAATPEGRLADGRRNLYLILTDLVRLSRR
jgi:hypothetical protein